MILARNNDERILQEDASLYAERRDASKLLEIASAI